MGLDVTDIPACYRHRAAELADSQDPKPLVAVCVEFDAAGNPFVSIFGDTTSLNARENTSILLETIGVLTDTAAATNAQASH